MIATILFIICFLAICILATKELLEAARGDAHDETQEIYDEPYDDDDFTDGSDKCSSSH